VSARTTRFALGGLLALLPLLVVPVTPFQPELVWMADSSMVTLATSAAIFAILAYGIGVLLRFLDLPSAGHGALFGVGAYAGGIAMERLGLGFEAGALFAVLVAVVAGAVMGVLALRTRGLHFLIITIALGELFVLVMRNWEPVTNGPLGLFLSETPSVFGMELIDPSTRYYVALAFMYVTVATVWWLSRSQFGNRLIAIRDNEPLARSLGINAFAYKTAAFVLTAAIAGVAGHLYFIHLRAITPDLFQAVALISVFLMVVMGGTKSLAGPAVGAWFVVFLPEWFAPLGLEDPTRQELMFGVLLIAFMLLAPLGIMGFVSRALDRVAPVEAPGRLHPAGVAETAPAPAEPGAGPAPSAGAPTADGTDPILRLEAVAKSFRGIRAVDGVSFEVHPGEIVGIIGPNGSGKTTLVNCISGFHPLSGGRVFWKGREVSGKRPDALAKLGLIRTFQQSMSFAEYSPRQHCDLVWGLSGASADGERSGAVGSVEELLELLGLADVADVPASDLSYGHVSNLGLAAALSTGLTELIVLDEPAAGLSNSEGRALQSRLLELRARGLTVLVIDHDMSFLMPMCDRMVVLDAGRKVTEGPPADVQRDARVIAAYLGERFAERAVARGLATS
jgi:ABC-type branched-subunit amino acid transport system permease subunit/ABC-type branched-subunit amino acid transport system ATPase component